MYMCVIDLVSLETRKGAVMYMCVIDFVSLFVFSIGFRIFWFSVEVRVPHLFSFILS
jgi:hypothetical protein